MKQYVFLYNNVVHLNLSILDTIATKLLYAGQIEPLELDLMKAILLKPHWHLYDDRNTRLKKRESEKSNIFTHLRK